MITAKVRVIILALLMPVIVVFSVAVTARGEQPVSSEAQRERSEQEGPEINVMDSTQSQWFIQGINAQLYFPGYTLNSVFSERDKGRLRDNLNLYKPSKSVKVVRSNKSGLASEGMITVKINGHLVKFPSAVETSKP